MKLKSVLAALMFTAASLGPVAAEEAVEAAPEFSKKVVNPNPIDQIRAAKRLIPIYCNEVTTRDGKRSLFGNQADCRGTVMRAYLAQLVAETAPNAQFKDSEE